MEEIWKPIKGFEGLYSISNLGRLFSNKTNRFKKPTKDKWGYQRASLFLRGQEKKKQIHRLVAIEFIEKIVGADMVNHKNGIPYDNRAENLEWVTNSQNQKHCSDVLNKKCGENHWFSRYPTEVIRKIRLLGERGLRASHIYKMVDVPYQYAYYVLKGKMRRNG